MGTAGSHRRAVGRRAPAAGGAEEPVAGDEGRSAVLRLSVPAQPASAHPRRDEAAVRSAAASAGQAGRLSPGHTERVCLVSIQPGGRKRGAAAGLHPLAAHGPAGAATAADCPCAPWWFVGQQQCGQSVVLVSQQQHARQSQRQQRVSLCVGGWAVAEGGGRTGEVSAGRRSRRRVPRSQPNRRPRAPLRGKYAAAGRGR